MKWGAYYVVDGRDGEAQAPPIAWVTEHQLSFVTGLPRWELKFPTGLSGIVVDVDADDPEFADEGDHVTIPTPDGPLHLWWAGPPQDKDEDEEGGLVMMLHECSPQLAEDLSGLTTVDAVQKKIYDYCCAGYPS